ncbi:MAG: sigma-70 family RNA polymerase sigma factor [Planctomycetota bacterium]|nr:sigma-70 family RNA polymerase sigma factor [Planctomycetota bacterium]
MPDADVNANDYEVNAQWVQDVVEANQTALLRHVVRYFKGDVERARDVVQDTFLKLWQADRKEIEPHLVQWLFTVSRNRALDVLRKERRMTALSPGNPPPDTVSLSLNGSTTPDRQLVERECKREALDLLDELPEKESEAIRLKLQVSLSYKEIAQVMGLTVSHVGVLIHQGLKSIRAELETPSIETTTATGLSGSGGRS